MGKLLLSIALALPVAALASPPVNLVQNGDFETFTGTFNNSHYSLVSAGSSALTGWNIAGTSVDVIHNHYYGAITGNSIDMLGSPGPGRIFQNLSTVVGQWYQLSFDLSANLGGDNNTAGKTVVVGLTGTPATSFVYEGSLTNSTPTVSRRVFNFLANSSTTELSFASNGAGWSGAVIDNVAVSVSPVPEPETYAMLLAGLGLIGGIAKRRARK